MSNENTTTDNDLELLYELKPIKLLVNHREKIIVLFQETEGDMQSVDLSPDQIALLVPQLDLAAKILKDQ